MVKTVNNVPIIFPSGETIKCSVEVHGRGGIGEDAWLILYSGRRITPLEQRIKGYKFEMQAVFQMIYSDKIESLLPTDWGNPFLSLPKKENNMGYYYLPVPLTEEHGFFWPPKKK